MKEILLFDGFRKVLVDDEDYEWLLTFGNWCYIKPHKIYYASLRNCKNGNKFIYMHRLIMEKHIGKSDLDVDHKDRNGLNNQKSNLRYATHSQNAINKQKTSKKSSSKYKGVLYDATRNSWIACLNKGNKIVFQGNFKEEIYAAIAYDLAAKEYYEDFAILNIKNPDKKLIKIVKSLIENPKKRQGTSKYIGVYKRGNNFTARLNSGKICHYLGSFKCEKDAAIAYNKKAQEILGEKAKLNNV